LTKEVLRTKESYAVLWNTQIWGYGSRM